jgi:hypothetical protein
VVPTSCSRTVRVRRAWVGRRRGRADAMRAWNVRAGRAWRASPWPPLRPVHRRSARAIRAGDRARASRAVACSAQFLRLGGGEARPARGRHRSPLVAGARRPAATRSRLTVADLPDGHRREGRRPARASSSSPSRRRSARNAGSAARSRAPSSTRFTPRDRPADSALARRRRDPCRSTRPPWTAAPTSMRLVRAAAWGRGAVIRDVLRARRPAGLFHRLLRCDDRRHSYLHLARSVPATPRAAMLAALERAQTRYGPLAPALARPGRGAA